MVNFDNTPYKIGANGYKNCVNCTGADGYRNAAVGAKGDFEWIGRQTLRGIPMTGLRSRNPDKHGLDIGDKVRVTVTSGTWQHSGVYDVQETHDPDVVKNDYNGELIIIHQNMLPGELASGTWEVVDEDTQNTPYVCDAGTHYNTSTSQCVTCPAGYTFANNECINPITGCIDGKEKDASGKCILIEEAGFELPPWAIWVGVGLVVGLGTWFLLKPKKVKS
jgi:hypothetical protein